MECLSEAANLQEANMAKLLERNTNREKPTDVDKVTALSPVLPKKLTNFSFIKSGSLEPIPVILVSYI